MYVMAGFNLGHVAFMVVLVLIGVVFSGWLRTLPGGLWAK